MAKASRWRDASGCDRSVAERISSSNPCRAMKEAIKTVPEGRWMRGWLFGGTVGPEGGAMLTLLLILLGGHCEGDERLNPRIARR